MAGVSCLVCGNSYRPSSLPGLLACVSCGFITADVALSQEALKNLYTANYFAGEEYKDYLGERLLIQNHFRIRLKKLLPHIGDPSILHLFEIGSAYGFFLEVAREHFASVQGIDISQDAASYAAEVLQLCVHAGDFLEYRLSRTPNVVCLWDTIEHLQHPDLYIQKIAAHIQPGGVIAMTTGDIGSLVARWRGAKWRQIHPPTHLHYFSKATLSRLLIRNGFRIRYCGYEGVHRSLDTIAYIILMIKHKRPKIYSALKRTRILDWSFYLNMYDILFVVAEKI